MPCKALNLALSPNSQIRSHPSLWPDQGLSCCFPDSPRQSPEHRWSACGWHLKSQLVRWICRNKGFLRESFWCSWTFPLRCCRYLIGRRISSWTDYPWKSSPLKSLKACCARQWLPPFRTCLFGLSKIWTSCLQAWVGKAKTPACLVSPSIQYRRIGCCVPWSLLLHQGL